MAQGQAGHTEKAEIRSKAMRTHLLFQGPFQIFSYQICFREAMEGAQLSNTKESTSSNRGVRRLAREAASSVSQARFVSFSFFSILFIFLPWHLLFYCERRQPLSTVEPTADSLDYFRNRLKRFRRVRGSVKRARSLLARALQLARRSM